MSLSARTSGIVCLVVITAHLKSVYDAYDTLHQLALTLDTAQTSRQGMQHNSGKKVSPPPPPSLSKNGEKTNSHDECHYLGDLVSVQTIFCPLSVGQLTCRRL